MKPTSRNAVTAVPRGAQPLSSSSTASSGWLRAGLTSVLVLSAGLLVAGQATANDPTEARAAWGHAAMMSQLDTDGDGRISRAEFEQGQQRALERRMQRFDQADTDRDGTLSPEEMQAWRETMRTRMAARGMHGMQGMQGMQGMHGMGSGRGMQGGHGIHRGAGERDSHGSHGDHGRHGSEAPQPAN